MIYLAISLSFALFIAMVRWFGGVTSSTAIYFGVVFVLAVLGCWFFWEVGDRFPVAGMVGLIVWMGSLIFFGPKIIAGPVERIPR